MIRRFETLSKLIEYNLSNYADGIVVLLPHAKKVDVYAPLGPIPNLKSLIWICAIRSNNKNWKSILIREEKLKNNFLKELAISQKAAI